VYEVRPVVHEQLVRVPNQLADAINKVCREYDHCGSLMISVMDPTREWIGLTIRFTNMDPPGQVGVFLPRRKPDLDVIEINYTARAPRRREEFDPDALSRSLVSRALLAAAETKIADGFELEQIRSAIRSVTDQAGTHDQDE